MGRKVRVELTGGQVIVGDAIMVRNATATGSIIVGEASAYEIHNFQIEDERQIAPGSYAPAELSAAIEAASMGPRNRLSENPDEDE